MTLADLVRSELVVLSPEVENGPDVIGVLAGRLVSQGYADPGLTQAALARERENPTGLLLTGGVHAAIPHADPRYCLTPAAAIAVVRPPVAFHRMDDPLREVDVTLVVMLCLGDEGSHLDALRSLGRILQDPSAVRTVVTAVTESEVIAAVAAPSGGSQ